VLILVEIATGQYEEKDFIVFKEKDPTGGDTNRWQESIDKWPETQSDPLNKYPKDQSSSNQTEISRKQAAAAPSIKPFSWTTG